MRHLIVSVAVIALPAFAQTSIFPSEATVKAAKQLGPQELSKETRAFLRGKMSHHNRDVRDLSIAVATLQHDQVQRLAQTLANAPRLDRAMGPASQLPDRFFDLQDELKKTAQRLADAGKANDLEASVSAYQQLIATCATCHASFKAQVEASPKP